MEIEHYTIKCLPKTGYNRFESPGLAKLLPKSYEDIISFPFNSNVKDEIRLQQYFPETNSIAYFCLSPDRDDMGRACTYNHVFVCNEQTYHKIGHPIFFEVLRQTGANNPEYYQTSLNIETEPNIILSNEDIKTVQKNIPSNKLKTALYYLLARYKLYIKVKEPLKFVFSLLCLLPPSLRKVGFATCRYPPYLGNPQITFTAAPDCVNTPLFECEPIQLITDITVNIKDPEVIQNIHSIFDQIYLTTRETFSHESTLKIALQQYMLMQHQERFSINNAIENLIQKTEIK